MMKLVSPGVLLLAVTLAGCALPDHGARIDDGEVAIETGAEFGVRRQREWDELKRLKADLAWDNEGPITFVFADGEVTVRSWFLEGGPGWEYVRAKFTYENTTDRPLQRVHVEMYIVNGAGEPVAASRVRLTHPWGWPLRPGTFFSDEIKVPTAGAHLDRGGWHWRVECIGHEPGERRLAVMAAARSTP